MDIARTAHSNWLSATLAAEDALPTAAAAVSESASASEGIDDAARQRLTEAAVKFESYFVAQLFKQMRAATAALADEDSAMKDRVNDSTLALAEQVVADGMAERRAFGIADVLLRQMLPPSTSPAVPVAPAHPALRKPS